MDGENGWREWIERMDREDGLIERGKARGRCARRTAMSTVEARVALTSAFDVLA
jgi:hypothetical protein